MPHERGLLLEIWSFITNREGQHSKNRNPNHRNVGAILREFTSFSWLHYRISCPFYHHSWQTKRTTSKNINLNTSIDFLRESTQKLKSLACEMLGNWMHILGFPTSSAEKLQNPTQWLGYRGAMETYFEENNSLILSWNLLPILPK